MYRNTNEKIVETLRRLGSATTTDLADHLPMTRAAVLARLRKMEKDGRVRGIPVWRNKGIRNEISIRRGHLHSGAPQRVKTLLWTVKQETNHG